MGKVQILTQGRHVLPHKTKVKQFFKGKMVDEGTISSSSYVANVECASCGKEVTTFVVDFSEVDPLYPTPDMEVPKEGIPFADGIGKLLATTPLGFMFADEDSTLDTSTWSSVPHLNYELVRTLPTTEKACSDCLKVTCECKRVVGWYKVLYEGKVLVRYWCGKEFRLCVGGSIIIEWKDTYSHIAKEPFDISKGAWCE